MQSRDLWNKTLLVRWMSCHRNGLWCPALQWIVIETVCSRVQLYGNVSSRAERKRERERECSIHRTKLYKNREENLNPCLVFNHQNNSQAFSLNSKFTKSYTIIIFVNANSKSTVIVRFREWSNPQQVEWCNLSAGQASNAHSRKEKEKNGEKEKWYSMQSTK